MRSRHTITYLADSLQPEVAIRPEGFGPGRRSEPDAGSLDLVTPDPGYLDGALDLIIDEPSIGEPELIDETRSELPVLPVELEGGERRSSTAVLSTRSATPMGMPVNQARPNLPWGLGTDGWPRRNSRLVRLFACEPEEFLVGVAGERWDCLFLSADVRLAAREDAAEPGWPKSIKGTMQMPYRSAPLAVELLVQPFHDRYSRVDVVLRSPHRWPRRFFDVASCCLTRMHHLER